MLAIVRILSVSMMLVITQPARALLDDYTFGPDDGLLVVDGQSKPIFAWQENKLLVPASLTKLISTQLAIQKWGLEHRFKTDFYLHGDQLWVKGYGDPFLISEELDLVAEALNKRGVSNQTVKSIYLDNSFYQISHVPGRSLVADPYNAPLSAISANFNTVNLRKVKGLLQSAEPQTPLTPTARRLASEMKTHDERVNLVNANNAQQHFAEIISIKLGLNDPEIHLNQRMSAPLQPVYRHENTNALEHLLRGALKYSNNFIANQLFLNLAEQDATEYVSFASANAYADTQLIKLYAWTDFNLEEGSGLSRANKFTAAQIQQVLAVLSPHKSLLKESQVDDGDVTVYAKTGTLDGVRSFAGYIEIADRSYQFVFMFNRKVPYGYRETVLHALIKDLKSKQ